MALLSLACISVALYWLGLTSWLTWLLLNLAVATAWENVSSGNFNGIQYLASVSILQGRFFKIYESSIRLAKWQVSRQITTRGICCDWRLRGHHLGPLYGPMSTLSIACQDTFLALVWSPADWTSTVRTQWLQHYCPPLSPQWTTCSVAEGALNRNVYKLTTKRHWTFGQLTGVFRFGSGSV